VQVVKRGIFALGILVFAVAVAVFFPSLSVRQPCSATSYPELGNNATETTIYFCPNGSNSPTFNGPDMASLNVGLVLALIGAILAAAGVLMEGEAPLSGTWENPNPVRDGQQARPAQQTPVNRGLSIQGLNEK
jgi:hypothetical protein